MNPRACDKFGILSWHVRTIWTNTDWLTYLLTPWSRILLEKLPGIHLVKKFPAFYGTRRFITPFTSSRHLSLPWASSTQAIFPQPTSWRSILILSSHLHLCLLRDLFPSGFPTKSLSTHHLSPIRATCTASFILLDLFCFLHSLITSSLLDPNTLLNTLFSNTLGLRFSLSVSDQVSHSYKTTGVIIVLYILIFIF